MVVSFTRGKSSAFASAARLDCSSAQGFFDALTSATLKHLREAWWDDAFTAFLEETLAPRPGNRILDVGCGEGLAEVEIGRLHISQLRLFGVDLVLSKVAGFFAVRYEVPADILSPPQAPTYPGLAAVVARSVHDVELVEGGKFRQKGAAETVSVLAVEHTVFDAENLTYDERELYKK